MKKKTAHKKSPARKTVKRTSHSQTLLFRRIVIISACLVLVVGIAATFNRGAASRAVAGMTITKGFFSQATITLPNIPNATSYNIYYGQVGDQNFTNSVRNISPNINNYTISYLKNGVDYQYRVSAADNSGREFYFSDIKPITNLKQM